MKKFGIAAQTLAPIDLSSVLGAHDEPELLTVETVENHVYFYADVNPDRCLALVREIRKLDQTLRNEALSRDLPADFPPTPIWLHIQSDGGDLPSALSVADQIPLVKTPVYSIVEGCCASAATLISMACQRRYILPSAFMLIHQLQSWLCGTYAQIQDTAHLLTMMMDTLTAFYAGHSRFTLDELPDMLKNDSWFNALECVDKGLVDEVKG